MADSYEEWVALSDAATALGISIRRVRFRIGMGHLRGNEPGFNTQQYSTQVTRQSLDREFEWQEEASWGQKARRLIFDLLP